MDAAGLRGAPNSRSARSAVLSTAAAVAAVFGLVGATEGLRDGPMLVSTVAPRQWLLLGADAAPVPARRLRDEEEEAAASPTTESPVTTQALETVAADPVTLATTEALSTQAQEPPSAISDPMLTTNNIPEPSPSPTIAPEASTEVATTQAEPSETTVPATLLPSPSTANDPSVPSEPAAVITELPSPPFLTVTGLPDDWPTSGGYETIYPAPSPPPTRGTDPARTTTKRKYNGSGAFRTKKGKDIKDKTETATTFHYPAIWTGRTPILLPTDGLFPTATMQPDPRPTGIMSTPGVGPQSRPAQASSTVTKMPMSAAAPPSAAPVFIEVLPTTVPAATEEIPDSTDPLEPNAPPGTRPSRVHIPGQTYDSSDPWASDFGGLGGGSGSSTITRTVLISAVGVTIAAIVLVVVGILVTRHRKAQNRRAGLGRSATVHRAPSAASGAGKPGKGMRKPPPPIETDAETEVAQKGPYSSTSDFAASAAWIATPTTTTMLVPPHSPLGRKKTVHFVTPAPTTTAVLNRTLTGSTATKTVTPESQTQETAGEAMVAEDSTLGEEDDAWSQFSLLSGPSAMSIRDVQLDKGGQTLVALTSGVERGQLRVVP